MLKDPMANFEIPTEMRNLAAQSVEQAKKAFDDFITAAQKAVTAVEGHATGAKASTKNIGQKAMAFAEKNVATSFEFAQKVVRAKDIQELTQLSRRSLCRPKCRRSSNSARASSASDRGPGCRPSDNLIRMVSGSLGRIRAKTRYPNPTG